MLHYLHGVRCIKIVRLWGYLLAIALALTACAKKKTLPDAISSHSLPALDDSSYKSPVPKIEYTVQLGAFQSLLRAQRLVEELQLEGIDAYFYEDRSGLIKVRFGSFDSKKDAGSQGTKLKEKGVIEEFYIVRPGNLRRVSKRDLSRLLEQRLVETAEGFIGIPYRWGGTSADKGFDCSGLTMTVYRLNGLDLPRKASSQYRVGQPVSRGALKNGDLVFFATNGDNRISHVGIYSGDNKFIHAPGKGKYIRISLLTNGYYKKHYRGARRYF